MALPDVSNAAHVVQLALSPIFLLSAVGSLLSVFTARLARISDQAEKLSAEPRTSPRQLARLRLRSRLLDVAVLFAAAAGALTCCAALTLFANALRSGAHGTVLFWLFGGALISAIAALAVFALEMLLAGRTVRDAVDQHLDDAGR